MNNVTTKIIGFFQAQIYQLLCILFSGVLILSVVGCSPEPASAPEDSRFGTQIRVNDTATPGVIETPTISPTEVIPQIDESPKQVPKPLTVWISPAVPELLKTYIHWPADLTPVSDAAGSNIQLVVQTEVGSGQEISSEWLYVLVAPFPTLLDEVALEDIQAAWRGAAPPHLDGWPILLEESTRLAFQSIWGPAGQSTVRVASSTNIQNLAWEDRPSLALVPFEMLDPRWKVIRVNGFSPLDPDLSIEEYPLALRFGLRITPEIDLEILIGTDTAFLPETNFDRDRMTSVMMTGVTALARSTALRMEEEGVLYPARDIGDVLSSADFTHISNEVPFFDGCPPAKPLRGGMRFCSDPRYIELLQAVGANVIELTGNHLLDWGPEAITFSLDFYQEHHMAYFGGGYNLEDARKPLLIEHNGNRLAFLGCNAIGPEAVFAGADSPGAARCDRDWMVETVHGLVDLGYLPIVTFQSIELDDPRPHSMQRADFNQMAEAGAVIVSGSQAHIPQAMAFFENRFVHYGLGNLFFDQMEPWQRPQFIDRHVFYDGRYINTELITTMLEDSARPRLMTADERERLLIRIFEISGW